MDLTPWVMMVTMSPAIWTIQWDRNLHLILVQNITQILHKNDCWIYTQMPTSGESRRTLIGIPIPGSLHLKVKPKMGIGQHEHSARNSNRRTQNMVQLYLHTTMPHTGREQHPILQE